MAGPAPAVAATRARIAVLSRKHPPTSPILADARRDHAEARIADYIQRALAAAPPLTDEQRSRLVDILKPDAA